MAKSTERVHFRLIVMPCCNFNACWVNPRLPNYCPECGKRVYPEVRSGILLSDLDARLSYHGAEDVYANLEKLMARRDDDT